MGVGGWGELHLQISSCLKRITVTSVKERQTKRTKKVKDVLFLYFQDDWILPNSWIPLGWCHCANVSVMLFILDKLKDLWENSRRRRLRLRLNCKLKACFSFWQWGLKRELTQCYKNQPTRDLLEYLTVFVCVSLHNADPILSTGIRHHGDETERWQSQVTLCCQDNCVALSAIFLQVSLFLFLFFSTRLSTSASLVAPGMRWTFRVLCVIFLTFPCSLWFS